MTLTPSQRVTLLKEIATRLEGESWPLIDVTLSQFSLPTGSEWNGGKDSYVLQMAKDAGDQTLIDLAQHVGFTFDEMPVSRIEPSFWRKGMLRVFLSHLATNRAYAATLQEACLRFGISCFVAHNDIEPTAEWQAQIETALSTCDSMVALLDPHFHASNWTDQEIGFAMGRGVPVFAVKLGQTPYGFIGRFQAFDGTAKPAAALAEELFEAYRKNKQTQRRMSEVVVRLFEESTSFAEAKSRMGYLERLSLWEPSFSSRLRTAVETNSQISDSWGVPERVEALINKWGSVDFEAPF
jgi:TIR domain